MPTEDQKSALNAINVLRAKYDCTPLQWDDDLENDAREYAQTLAQKNGNLEHDTIPQEKAQAECLAMLYDNFKPENIYTEAVRNWHDKRRDTAGNEIGPGEEDMYFEDPERRFHFGDWGHFAILVSKKADKTGLSFAVAEEDSPMFPPGGKQIYVVARVHGAFGVSNPNDLTLFRDVIYETAQIDQIMGYRPSLSVASLSKRANREVFDTFDSMGDDANAVANHMNATTIKKRGRNPTKWTDDDCRSIWHRVSIWGNVHSSKDVPSEWLDEDHFADWLKDMAAAKKTPAADAAHYLAYRDHYLHNGHTPTQQELSVLFGGPANRSNGLTLTTIGPVGQANAANTVQPATITPAPAIAPVPATAVSVGTTGGDDEEEEEQSEEAEDQVQDGEEDNGGNAMKNNFENAADQGEIELSKSPPHPQDLVDADATALLDEDIDPELNGEGEVFQTQSAETDGDNSVQALSDDQEANNGITASASLPLSGATQPSSSSSSLPNDFASIPNCIRRLEFHGDVSLARRLMDKYDQIIGEKPPSDLPQTYAAEFQRGRKARWEANTLNEAQYEGLRDLLVMLDQKEAAARK